MKRCRTYEWVILALIIAAAIVILPLDSKLDQSRDDISTRDDSINSLNRLNGALEIELQLLDSSLVISEEQIEGFEGVIDSLKQKRIEDKIKYDEEIANITAIPGDSLYKLVTDRLN